MAATVDLITGFLGAGKTTFIRSYGAWLRRRGIPYVVVENEFGIASVDSAILKNDGAQVAELSGGCICCGLKRDFAVLLSDVGRTGARIVVEPSGIFNPHDFFDIVFDPTLKDQCQLGGVVTIVDPHSFSSLDESTLDMLREQINCSRYAILSKTDGLPPERAAVHAWDVRNLIENPSVAGVEARPWEQFGDDDYERFFFAEAPFTPRSRRQWNHSAMFETALVFGVSVFTENEILERIDVLSKSSAFGTIIRVKGYLKPAGEGYFEVNCTPRDRSIRRVDGKHRPFLTVIGRSLNRELLAKLFKDAKVG